MKFDDDRIPASPRADGARIIKLQPSSIIQHVPMRTIPVKSYPVMAAFSSADAAIKHARNYPPLVRAKADAQLLQGSRIIDAFWTDADFAIGFSNGRYLHVWVDSAPDKRLVKWRVLESAPSLAVDEMERQGSPPVALEFPSGSSYLMDRSTLISALKGAKFKSFYVTESGFYLYTETPSNLVFHCVYQRGTGENKLYVGQGE